MHELEDGRGRAGCRQLVAHVIFHRFDVVIGPLLDSFDGGGGLAGWRFGKFFGALDDRVGDRRCRGQARRALCGEREQPLGLEADTFTNQGGFGEMGSKRCGPLGIASIDR